MTKNLSDLVALREFFHGEYRLRKMLTETDMAVFDAHYAILTHAVDTLVPKNAGADHTEVLDLLLDYRLFETDSCGKYTISADLIHDRIWNKVQENAEWYGLLQTLYAAVCNDDQAEASLDHLFNLSINSGLYSTHLSVFLSNDLKNDSPVKDYPIRDFTADFLKDLTEPAFMSIKQYPADVEGALRTLSPSEFYLEYEPQSPSAPVIPCWSAMLVRTDMPFNIVSTLSEIEKYLVQQVVDHKLLNSQPVSDEEAKLFLKYNAAMDGSKIQENRARSRLIGLKMWDIVNVFGKIPHEAFNHLAVVSQELYGHRTEICGDKKFKYTSCEACVKEISDICFISCCGLLKTATKSVNAGRIEPSGS